MTRSTPGIASNPASKLAIRVTPFCSIRKRIACRELFALEENCLRTLDGAPIDGPDVIDDAEQRVECGLDRIAPADRGVAMQDLLQHLGVGH